MSGIYYMVLWAILGRDPKKGTIVPRFYPPKGMSPAAVRFVMNMGYDSICLVANVLSLMAKGKVKIKYKPEVELYFLDYVEGVEAELEEDERLIEEHLKEAKTLILSSGVFNENIARMEVALLENLTRRFGRYFKSNALYTYLPPLIYLLMIVWEIVKGINLDFIMAINDVRYVFFVAIFTFITVAFVFSIARTVYDYILSAEGKRSVAHIYLYDPRPFLSERSPLYHLHTALPEIIAVVSQLMYKLTRKTKLASFAYAFASVLVLVMITSLYIGFLVLLQLLKPSLSYFTTLSGLPLLLAMAWIWDYYMRRPTKEGRKLMDEVEGFKVFLQTAEKEKLRRIYNRDLPEIYERFLPYAYALGIEGVWAEKFAYSFEGYESYDRMLARIADVFAS